MIYLTYNDGELSTSRVRHPESRVVELEDLVRAVDRKDRDRLVVAVWDGAPSIADTLTRDDFIANTHIPLAAANAVREYAESQGL